MGIARWWQFCESSHFLDLSSLDMGVFAFHRKLQTGRGAPMFQIGLLPGKYVHHYWEYLQAPKMSSDVVGADLSLLRVFKLWLTILQSTWYHYIYNKTALTRGICNCPFDQQRKQVLLDTRTALGIIVGPRWIRCRTGSLRRRERDLVLVFDVIDTGIFFEMANREEPNILYMLL